jgi:hypothetical protein
MFFCINMIRANGGHGAVSVLFATWHGICYLILTARAMMPAADARVAAGTAYGSSAGIILNYWMYMDGTKGDH